MSKSKRSVIAGQPVTKRIPLPAGGVRIETYIPWELIKDLAENNFPEGWCR